MPFWKKKDMYEKENEKIFDPNDEEMVRLKKKHQKNMRDIKAQGKEDKSRKAWAKKNMTKDDYDQWKFNRQVESDSESEQLKEKIARLKAERERFVP